MNDFNLLSIIGDTIKSPLLASFMKWLGEPDSITPIYDYEVFTFHDKGIEMYVDDSQRISSISVYGAANQEHGAYKHPLPHEISFDDAPMTAEEKLGRLNPLSVVGTGTAWRRFDFAAISIHLKYTVPHTSIEELTIMTAQMLAKHTL